MRLIWQTAVAFSTFICLVSSAKSAELIVVESEDQTSKDLPLKFELEKTTWEFDTFQIWGKVENTGKAKYKFVRVTFTCKDKDKKFLGRKSWFVDPSEIGKDEVSYIEGSHVETEGRKPAIVEWKVTGELGGD